MTTYAAVFALALGYLALVGAYCALRSLYRLRRAAAVLSRGATSKESLLEAVERHIATTEALAAQVQAMQTQLETTQAATTQELRAQVEAMRSQVEETQNRTVGEVASEHTQIAETISGFGSTLARSLRNVALVRFDAFDDMSGRMSFSLALLDDSGDGVTLTSIAGRTDSRLYAKGVSQGSGEHDLSPEEAQAVDAALSRRPKRREYRKAS
ncbi:uncharacterized protein DUF4446 [Jatrophihabitans sp. GAS493]|uniref:DUF4446 family protein n=1 Tax=Jatrophihabitans sp. GAS493 TaxID=1907575 RepID=UPI000BBFEDD2|nr:DUF4446 family protein [Jatrophihabitans sp. GAS493]SOD71102.1 uncharacterized protein DUF4446 [Jatrophihabitans sp. GAS493]